MLMVDSHAGNSSQSVTIAIINYNGRSILGDTIDSVLENCPDVLEVLLIDNDSSDGSVDYVSQHYSSIRIIPRKHNDGPGGARNLAIESATTRYVLLIDNDVAPCAGCLSPLVEALSERESVVAAMPAIVYQSKPHTVQFVGGDAHFMGTVAPLQANQSLMLLNSAPRLCTSLISAAMMIDRARLGTHQLFSDNLFIYQEDHEAGYRCGIAALDLICVPEARCLHGDGTSGLSIRKTGVMRPERVKQTLLNRWYVVVTLYQRTTLLRFLPALVFYEVVVFFGLLIGGHGRDWRWAAKEFARRLPAIRSQRQRNQTSRLRSDARILKGGAFPFNEEIRVSLLQRLGQSMINGVCLLNWCLAKPGRFSRSATPDDRQR